MLTPGVFFSPSAYSAVQFTTYETLKQLFTEYEDGEAGEKGKGKLGTGLKLVAGSLAGIASVHLFRLHFALAFD